MKNKWFYNNLAFRLAAPLLLGIAVYLLVLMFFDSVGMLMENFFSREVLFVIGLTGLFLETNRLLIVILNKVYPLIKEIRFRIIIQYTLSFILTISVISLALYFYFVYFIGFSTITTELITFNTIFILVAILYHLYFFSFVFLNKRNDSRIQHEKTKKENLELELETFKNQVNPSFLFQSLEIIISSLYNNKKRADDLLEKLAKSYRYTLDNQQNELVPIQFELNSIDCVLAILEEKFGKALQVKLSNSTRNEKQLIPGTLQTILEHAIFRNIITSSLPMQFEVVVNEESMQVSHSLNPVIKKQENEGSRFQQLIKTYSYYTKTGITISEENKKTHLLIPLITLDEE